ERHGEAVVAVDRFPVEPATVAQPAPVDRVAVDAEVAYDVISTRLDHGAAPHRTRRARALRLVEIPRACLEAVRLRGERTDRADLHRVAAEVADEGLVGEREDLRVVATAGEADQRVTGDLVGETRATVAQDAALPVEQHQIADRDRLFEVPLLLDVPALTGAMAEGLVLQRALAALVADRAVERMVRQEQFDDAFLGLERGRALRV